MRHDLTPRPISPGTRRMRKASTARELIASSGFAHPVAACVDGAVVAVTVAAIAPAANEDLRPATGAQVQAAHRQLHWRFPRNAKEQGVSEIDAPRRQCDTDSSRGSAAGRQASQMETLWRRDAGLDLAVEAGVAPVVLP
jgi:hypothetical protein